MLVNPANHASVKNDLGQAFIDWLISPADYNINGEQLFNPNANDSNARDVRFGPKADIR
jgi:tungstate transport system substrate-binding protein